MLTKLAVRFCALAGISLAVPVVLGAPLTLEEIVALKRVTSVELSPNGERIAYLLQVPRTPYEDDDGAAYSELHVSDLNGSSRGYVTGEINVREVSWSSDGVTLYYRAKRDDDEHVALYAIAVDGGESRKLYEHDADIEAIRPSPDGRRLAFLATEGPRARQEDLEEKGFKAEVYEESRLPTDVWLLDLESPEPEAARARLPGSVSVLEWAPHGRQYVVALAPTPLIDDFYVNRRLSIVDSASGRVVRQIEHVGKLGPFAWSPDGRRVAFVGAVDEHDPLEGRVFVAQADGEEVVNLTPEYPGHVHEIHWRDDDTLWYRGSRGLWTELDTLEVDGRSVTSDLAEGAPIARAFSARPGAATLAVLADTPRHPPEVFSWRQDRGFRRLTHSNPVLDDRDLAPQEPVRFEARDGLMIEGVLIRPLDERRGGRHPLVIAVHGGPESHYSHGWMSSYTFPAQAMAGEDYAFFYPNYRASTGRGVEFSMSDHGDPAGLEFDDLVDAKDHLVATGLADRERVGISGGSYGGYATMWASTALTEHFAAGVAFVGLSDLIGSLGTSDIPNELYLVHLRRWPWDDWQFALERSPIYHAAQARTPLLILGGDADPRVDPSQSLALYRHIKLRTDTPVRLVRYPGEGHGNRNTAAQLDYAMRMKRWLDHYLKGPGGAPPDYELDHAARLAAAEPEDDADDADEPDEAD
jgi:dipeptidyl aminopeptidase/acylaminoacyl peptidase